MTPGSEASGPLFDALDAPLPSELERQAEPPRSVAQPPQQTKPQPHVEERPRIDRATRAARRRIGTRRVKRTVKHVDPLSVLKISLVYYAVFLVLWLIAVAILYNILDGAGLFDSIDKLGKGLVLWDKVDISLGLVEKWAFFLGVTFVVLASLLNVFLAFLYNLVSDLVGGIQVTFVERDLRQ